MERRIVVLDAPSNLGLRPPPYGGEPGCSDLPRAIRATGLVERLGATDAGVVNPPIYHRDPDPATGIWNARAIEEYSVRLADRIGGLIGTGLLVVLGGDCSILLGPMLALRRIGRYGLASVDGGLDFRHPGNAGDVGGYGAVAGEHLALLTGRGYAPLADLEGRRPLVREADVVALGHRELGAFAAEIASTPMRLFDVAAIRRLGPASAAEQALLHLTHAGLVGFWIHVDVDVLDPGVMPAVDSPEPDGLMYEELSQLVGRLVSSERCIGMQVTIFDPRLDPTGELAVRLTDTIVEAVSRT